MVKHISQYQPLKLSNIKYITITNREGRVRPSTIATLTLDTKNRATIGIKIQNKHMLLSKFKGKFNPLFLWEK